MAKKPAAKRPKSPTGEERPAVTPDRFTRLNLLVTLLAKAPQTREVLARKIKLDVRGFYRDLEALRQAGIVVVLENKHYHLEGPLDDARNRLPCPDPLLTLGEMTQLARGRSAVHLRLRGIIKRLVS